MRLKMKLKNYKKKTLFILSSFIFSLCFLTSCNLYPPEDPKIVSTYSYYQNFYGHSVRDLDKVYSHLKAKGSSSLIYLAGDSSLDNKYW